jgi:flavin reductase ActVB
VLTAADVALPFREAMGHLACGVVMVTSWVDGKPWGLTISACCSVSMDPPTLLVSLGEHTVSARSIEETGRFGVSILSERQVEAARFGSAAGAPKFLGSLCDERDEACETPILAGALAHVDCEVAQIAPVADHAIVIGAVRAVVLSAGPAPLLYYARRYRVLEPPMAGDPRYAEW